VPLKPAWQYLLVPDNDWPALIQSHQTRAAIQPVCVDGLDGRILKRHSEKSNAISISRRHSHAHPPQKQKRGLPSVGDQQLATMRLSTPQDVRARLLHRLVRHTTALRLSMRGNL
jgi:hypothetical protein